MNMRKTKKLAPHISYWAGFSGYGPTLLDIEPPLSPRLSPKEKQIVQRFVKEVQSVRQQAFRQSCLEVLGEDPDDWGKPISQRERAFDAARKSRNTESALPSIGLVN